MATDKDNWPSLVLGLQGLCPRLVYIVVVTSRLTAARTLTLTGVRLAIKRKSQTRERPVWVYQTYQTRKTAVRSSPRRNQMQTPLAYSTKTSSRLTVSNTMMIDER